MPDEDLTNDAVPRDLNKIERGAAALLGVVGVGTGGVGIFFSTNQAGTTTILLIGAVFLLMAVQGTGIVKVGKDSVELGQRQAAKRLASEAVNAFEAHQNVRGNALVEAVRIVAPGPVADRELQPVSDFVYEEGVVEAIERVIRSYYPSLKLERQVKWKGVQLDGLITDQQVPDRRVGVEIAGVGYDRSLPSTVIEHTRERVKAIELPTLLVTMDSLSKATTDSLERTESKGYPPIQAIRWDGEDDQGSLINAIGALMATYDSSPPPG